MMIVMVQASQSRGDMLAGALVLLRERGYSGTSFSELIESTGAPRGSIYHHFPGGKQQLAREAVEIAQAYGDAVFDRAGGDPVRALELFAETWRSGLIDSGFRSGCPVAGVVTGLSDDNPELLGATAACFESWRSRLAAMLRQSGLSRRAAERRSTLAVAAIEGAIMLSRAQKDIRPFDDTVAELRTELLKS